MTRRRDVLAGFVGMAALAAFDSACGPAIGLPSATRRKYRIGLLAQRIPECVVESDWQVSASVAIKTVQTRRPNPHDCVGLENLMLDALETRGYRLGENLEWIVATPAKDGATEVTDLAQPAAALVALGVEIIITNIVAATVAAAQATKTTPIIAAVADILDTGLVSNLAKPGGNITGTTQGRLSESTLKRFELLKEAFPGVRNPILVYGNFAPHLRALQPTLEAARAQLSLPTVPILLTGDGADFAANARRALDDGADSLVAMGTHPSAPGLVLPLARQRRLPTVLPAVPEFIDAGGGLIGLGFSRDFGTVADYVDRILRGANPGDLPIAQLTKVDLVVNLKAARELGLIIAPSVLARATRVIE